MSFWENTQLFVKNKAGLFSKKLLLLFTFLFLYTSFLTFYGWSNFNNGFNLMLVYAQLVPLILYVIIIFILIKRPNSLDKKAYRFDSPAKKHKYEKTGLPISFSLELKNKLERLMVTQKLYLNHELRLDDVAELLDISRHHASQVINENFKMSFYDYINSYRIEEAKNKLSTGFENSTQSISDLAYQCGFNNRVSFYKAFKKITKTTPTEFIANAA